MCSRFLASTSQFRAGGVQNRETDTAALAHTTHPARTIIANIMQGANSSSLVLANEDRLFLQAIQESECNGIAFAKRHSGTFDTHERVSEREPGNGASCAMEMGLN